MRKELKRLFMGFIYSLMTFSFIMMPIPFSGLAHAQRGVQVDTYTDENGNNSVRSVYKQGDDLSEAVNDAKAENYGETEKGLKGFIAQATSGMMALSLLNALFFKYKYEDPIESIFYGNDCPKNKAAKVTVRVAQFGSLMYLIGDLTANFKFTKVAADASDELQNFNPTEKTDFENMTEEEMAARREAEPEAADNAEDEENKQILAFEKLLNVLNGKKDAIETKKKMATVASIAYGINTGIEIVSLVKCARKCTFDTAIKETTKTLIKPSAIALITPIATKQAALLAILEPTAATKAQAAACGKLIAAINASNAKIGVKIAKNEIKSTQENAAKLAMSTAGANAGQSAFATVPGILTGAGGNVINVVNGSIGAVIAVSEEGKKAIKASNAIDAADQAASGAAEKATNTTLVTLNTACMAESGGKATAALLETYLTQYFKYAYTPVTCCGGDGIGAVQVAQFIADLRSYHAMLVALAGATEATADQIKNKMDAATQRVVGKAFAKGKEQAAQKTLEKAFGAMAGFSGLSQEMANQAIMDAMNLNIALPVGSFPAHGLPKIPMLNFNNDIILGGILNKYSLNDGVPSKNEIEQMKRLREMETQRMFEVDEDSKLFVKSNFESMLRTLARQNFVNTEFTTPIEDFRAIARSEQEIKNIMFFFNQVVDESSGMQIANNDITKHRYWNMISNMMSNLIMPKANAFISNLGGGGSLAVAGLLLPQIASMLGLPPEWNSVLKVGGKIMMVQGLLGGVMKTWGLVSPLGRSISWGVMTAILLMVRKWDGDAIDKIKERIKLVEAEKLKYMNSVAKRTAGAGKSYQGANYQKNNYKANSQKAGGAFIKTCVNATQGGFKPAGSCPGNTTKSTFKTDKPSEVEAKMMAPVTGKAMSTISNLASKTANGSLRESDISGSKLDEIEKMDAAIRAHNDKLTRALDKFNDLTFKGKKNKPASLLSSIAKARNALTGGAGPIEGSLAAFGNSSSAPNTVANTKDENSGIVTSDKKGGSAGGGGAIAPSAGGFDLDLLGDDMGGEGMADATGDAAGETAAKAEENLNDFEINHDDINKKTEVSIFKILSNRYILSYPKVLEEEIMDTGGGDTKAPEESKSLEDQLDQVKQ